MCKDICTLMLTAALFTIAKIETSSKWPSVDKGWRRWKKALIIQFCPTLCDPFDYSTPGYAVHGTLQARYWSGLPFPSPRDLSDPGNESESPALQMEFLLSEPPRKPQRRWGIYILELYLAIKQKWNLASSDSMDGLSVCYANLNKSNEERQILYDFTHMRNVKIKKQNKHTDTENRVVVTRGDGAGEDKISKGDRSCNARQN